MPNKLSLDELNHSQSKYFVIKITLSFILPALWEPVDLIEILLLNWALFFLSERDWRAVQVKAQELTAEWAAVLVNQTPNTHILRLQTQWKLQSTFGKNAFLMKFSNYFFPLPFSFSRLERKSWKLVFSCNVGDVLTWL